MSREVHPKGSACGDKVAISEEVHAEYIPLDEYLRRVGEVKAEVGAGYRDRCRNRPRGRRGGLMNAASGDLGCSVDLRRRVEDVKLQLEAQVTALTTNEIELVARSYIE